MSAIDAAYRAYLDCNPLKRGNATQHAFPAGFRAGVESVGPAWRTITLAQQLEHIEQCRDMCVFCEGSRSLGRCTSCETDPAEARPPFGESVCCGSPVCLGAVS